MQHGVGLLVGLRVVRLRLRGGAGQRAQQLVAQRRADAQRRQPRQHAFKLAQRFHHRDQFVRPQLAHVDAGARNDVDQAARTQQQQRLAHRRARGVEAQRQRLFVDGHAGRQRALLDVFFEPATDLVLQAGGVEGFRGLHGNREY